MVEQQSDPSAAPPVGRSMRIIIPWDARARRRSFDMTPHNYSAAASVSIISCVIGPDRIGP